MWRYTAVLSMALAAAACGDNQMTNPLAADVAGEYAATSSRGEFLYVADGETSNLAAEGGVVELQIWSNGTTTGRIFVPAEGPTAVNYEADLSGTWASDGDHVFFTHNGPATIVSYMRFVRDGDKLHAEQQFSDAFVKLTLVK